jgi:hypothetical protein
MSQQEEYQKLARKFVDIWQEHMAAMLNDGEFIRGLLSMMQGSAFSVKDPFHANPSAFQSPRGAASASDAYDAALASLAYSLAAIEKRLERLEHAGSGRDSSDRQKAKGSVDRAARKSKARRGGRAGSAKKGRRVS